MELLAGQNRGMARRARMPVVLAGLALLVLGQPYASAESTGPAPAADETGASSALALVIVWDAQLGREMGRVVDLDDGQILATSLDRRCALFDLESGRRLWEVRRGGGIQAGATLAGDAVLGVSDHPAGWLFCLERADGAERWRAALGEAWGAPVADAGRVFAASLHGRVLACSLDGGRQIWSTQLSALVRAPLLLTDSLLIVPTISDSLIALRLTDGSFVWGATPHGALYGAPVAAGGHLWTLSHEGRLCAFDPAGGGCVASRQLDGYFRAGLVAADSVLIAVNTAGQLSAYDRASLQQLWSRELGGVAELRATIHNGEVWVGLRDGGVHAFRLLDGRPAAALSIAPPVAAPVVLHGHHVVLASGNAGLIVYRWTAGLSPTGPAPAASPPVDPDLGAVNPGRDPAPWTAPPMPVTSLRSTFLRADESPRIGWASPLGPRFVAAAPLSAAGDEGAAGGARELPEFCESGIRGAERGGRHTLLRWVCVGGWLLGAGAALWMQDEADDQFAIYRRAGDPDRREQAFDRAEAYDRGAVGSWLVSELFFALGLWAWLGGR